MNRPPDHRFRYRYFFNRDERGQDRLVPRDQNDRSDARATHIDSLISAGGDQIYASDRNAKCGYSTLAGAHPKHIA